MKQPVSVLTILLGNGCGLWAMAGLLLLASCSFKSQTPEALTDPDGVSALSEIADVDIDRSEAGKMDPSTWEVSQNFRVGLRLVEPHTTTPLVGQRFHVSVSSNRDHFGTPKVVTARGDGRVDWQDSLRFAYAASPQNLPRFIVITSAETNSAFGKRVIPIHLNPWAVREDQFFWNTAFAGEPKPLPEAPTEIEVAQLQFSHIQNNDDQVVADRHLQLTENRRYHVAFSPILRRPPVFGPESLTQAFPEGAELNVTLLVSAPLKNGVTETQLESHQFVGAFEVRRPVKKGRVEFDLTLSTDFGLHPVIESRVQLTALISPVGHGLLPKPGAGLVRSFSALPNGTDQMNLTLDAWPSDTASLARAFSEITSSEKVVAEETAAGRLWKVRPALSERTAPILAYASQVQSASGNIDKFYLGAEPVVGWPSLAAFARSTKLPFSRSTEGAWQRLLTPNTNWENAKEERAELVAQALYPLCLRPGIHRAKCTKAPAEYFVVTRASVVDQIDATKPFVSTILRDSEQIAVTFFEERLQTIRYLRGEKKAEGNEAKAGGQVGLTYLGTGPSGGFNFKSEHESFWTQEVGVTKDARSRAGVTHTVTLWTDRRTVEFQATSWSCLHVRPRAFLTPRTTTTHPNGALVCSKQASAPMSETWYSLRDRTSTGSTAMADQRNIRDRGWWKVIRGSQRFADFKKRVNEAENVLRFRRIEPFEGGADRILDKQVQAAPETITVLKPDDGFSPGVIAVDEVVPWSLWEPAHFRSRVADCTQFDGALSVEELAEIQAYCTCLYGKAAEVLPEDEYVRMSRSNEDWKETSGIHSACIEHANRLGSGSEL